MKCKRCKRSEAEIRVQWQDGSSNRKQSTLVCKACFYRFKVLPGTHEVYTCNSRGEAIEKIN